MLALVRRFRCASNAVAQGRGMHIVDDHEVTKSEQVTRFVCGAILGVAVAVAVTYRLELSSVIWKALTAILSILGCGILALIHGDRFWQAILGQK